MTMQAFTSLCSCKYFARGEGIIIAWVKNVSICFGIFSPYSCIIRVYYAELGISTVATFVINCMYIHVGVLSRLLRVEEP